MATVFVLHQTRMYRSCCDIQTMEEFCYVLGVYSSLRSAKAALRKQLRNHEEADDEFYEKLWRGDLLEEGAADKLKSDLAALYAGDDGAEEKFKLNPSTDMHSYMGDPDNKLIDREDGGAQVFWNECSDPPLGEYSVCTYWHCDDGESEVLAYKISKSEIEA